MVPAVPGHAAHTFWLQTDSHRLAAWDWGIGRETVLLVHGWSGYASQLAPFVEPLLARGFHVATFDLPGHGQSSGELVTLVDFAKAIRAVASRLGPVSAVIGHSIGGTATALALQQGLKAERVVLLAPPAHPRPYAAGLGAQLGLSSARIEGMLEKVARELNIELDALDLRKLAPAMLSQLLLMHDRNDRDVPYEHGKTVAEAWPGGRLVTLDALGHRRLLKDAKVISQAVEFIAQPRAPLAKAS
jgi:pimeloyl-ACP methyl ester carboxylesterase